RRCQRTGCGEDLLLAGKSVGHHPFERSTGPILIRLNQTDDCHGSAHTLCSVARRKSSRMTSLEPAICKRLHVVQYSFLVLPKAASIFYKRSRSFRTRQKCPLHGVPLFDKIGGFHRLVLPELLN